MTFWYWPIKPFFTAWREIEGRKGRKSVPHLTGEMQSAAYGLWSKVPSGHMHPSDMPEHCTVSYSNSLLGHEGAVQVGRHAWYCSVPGHTNATKNTQENSQNS